MPALARAAGAMKAAAAVLGAGLFALAHGAPAAPSDDLLEPDQAFRPTARLLMGPPRGTVPALPAAIQVEYRIAQGYYLYRDRLRFDVQPPGLPVMPAEFPPATAMDDPFIGKTFIYREKVTITLPFSANVANPGAYRVRITAQGCAEERFCYSPFRQEVPIVGTAPSP
jgi:thiol:disulfide interchange protein DsbD